MLVELANNIYCIETHGIFRRKYIRIERGYIALRLHYLLREHSGGGRIEQVIVKRFCKQHKLKLRYRLASNSELSKSPLGSSYYLSSSYYLIGI